jgi:lipoprotein-anchoring transpeptidase ErfK/SrfK
MHLLARLRALKSVGLLPAASLLAAMLIALAAGTASAQTESTSIPEWGVTGSAPQTGSSAYTSGEAFSAPNGQPGTAAPAIPVDASPPSAAPAQTPKAAEPSASKILILIDKLTQTMKVLVDNLERYSWDVSTGLRAYDTPSGTYAARSMNEIWYSKQWDDAPMPHAIFFTKKGHAIHGTEETQKLGRPASHGCVRLAPENARNLFALVKETGLEATEVVLTGAIPKDEVRAASHGPRKQQIKPGKKAGTVLNRPSGKSRVAVSKSRKRQSGGAKVTKPEIKPSKKAADLHFDPRDLKKTRRLSRREWLQLYYSGPPQISPPRDEYETPRRRRRALRP